MFWFYEYLLLTWGAITISLANVILLGWLGLTVLLNAERRDAGVFLAGTGLLLGAAFFVSHTALLSLSLQELEQANWRLNLWWRAGWLPLAAAPFAWYLMILWYTGYWQSEPFSIPLQPELRLRHRVGFGIACILLLLLMAMLFTTGSLPTFTQMTQRQIETSFKLGGAPLLLILFPLYILLCIGLALDALHHPLPSSRLMGDQARARARPWLIGATTMLLLVSLLVAGAIFWLLYMADITVYDRAIPLSLSMARVDLLLSCLIGLAIFLIGQAIISYEIFTSSVLPRQALRRNWLNAVALALCFGALAGSSFTFQFEPISTMLLAALLMTGFYALLNRTAYRQREEDIRQLRPFVGSQHLYEQLLSAATSAETPPSNVSADAPFQHNGEPPFTGLAGEEAVDTQALFYNLCHNVLEVEQAHLVPLGALAPILGNAINYPQADATHQPLLAQIVEQQSLLLAASALHMENSPIGVALNPDETNGLCWAIPLWSERGLIGFFLLGHKRNGSLFTQEEIEIARASGERLIDTQAGIEIGRRLLALQRRQLAESQLLDRRARRILHDEILPQLHTALLSLASLPSATTEPDAPQSDVVGQIAALLTDAHRQVSALLRTMPARAMPQLAEVGLIGALEALVEGELSNAFDAVHWQVEESAQDTISTLSPLTQEVLFYAVREAMRNAARHGRSDNPQRSLTLNLSIAQQNGLHIQVQDNGVGLPPVPDTQAAHGVAHPLHSGNGLAMHSTLLAIVGGELAVTSAADGGVCVTIWLPI